MNRVIAVLAAIWSLFVDDALFAAMTVAWLGLIDLLANAGFNSGWHGVLLFGGLGLILMHGTLRKTGSR